MPQYAPTLGFGHDHHHQERMLFRRWRKKNFEPLMIELVAVAHRAGQEQRRVVAGVRFGHRGAGDS